MHGISAIVLTLLLLASPTITKTLEPAIVPLLNLAITVWALCGYLAAFGLLAYAISRLLDRFTSPNPDGDLTDSDLMLASPCTLSQLSNFDCYICGLVSTSNRALACGHCFCNPCLRDLLERGVERCRIRGWPGGSIRLFQPSFQWEYEESNMAKVIMTLALLGLICDTTSLLWCAMRVFELPLGYFGRLNLLIRITAFVCWELTAFYCLGFGSCIYGREWWLALVVNDHVFGTKQLRLLKILAVHSALCLISLMHGIDVA